MAAVAYIRVSTDKQDADNQRLEILRLANDRALGQVRFVEEVVSGRKSWRDREIASVLDSLKAGDALVVAEFSRLGRSMLEIMEILSIATQRGVKVLPQRQLVARWVAPVQSRGDGLLDGRGDRAGFDKPADQGRASD